MYLYSVPYNFEYLNSLLCTHIGILKEDPTKMLTRILASHYTWVSHESWFLTFQESSYGLSEQHVVVEQMTCSDLPR